MRTVSLRLTGLLLLAGLAFSVVSCETPDVSPKGGKGGCGTQTGTTTTSGTGTGGAS
ncbi:hypothetical protein LJ737_25925 [Hymenobacter sp. 15J16-1T3B]|uniref:hypothetical protein n=1 Tax=Hymenobacter sp. 15J16-1T3B TaxID=2886941 RepID=UPI001D113F22|nr:hypothetical protein [Hymenobacter sp. 15J16-1T3B]MCC3160702.1 hypothetical protein [Hymenobacter sp. 15J16-1T3B]